MMINWSIIFSFSIVSAALVLGVLGLLFTISVPSSERWNKRFFQHYFTVLLLCCLFALAEMLFSYYSVLNIKPLYYFIMVPECLTLSLPMPMLTIFLLHCGGKGKRSNKKLLYPALGLWAAYSILLLSALFLGIFSHDAVDDQYYRGPLYPLLLLPLIAILALNLAGTIRRRAYFARKVFFGLLTALLPMTFALVLQIFFDVFPLIDISYVISALVMYSFVLSDQIKQDQRHQREIANQHVNIMVLQMRPHFIYNAMTSIYYLVDADPQAAKDAIRDFSKYLHQNFSAVVKTENIPFEEELAHTRAYLAIEKARFSDRLDVTFDTPNTQFFLPPLTLEPLVENAVKHGMDPDCDPLHILIRTRAVEDGNEITVINDGAEFKPTESDDDGVGLKSVRERLELMCGGTLRITPMDGGGAAVTLWIPKDKEPKKA